MFRPWHQATPFIAALFAPKPAGSTPNPSLPPPPPKTDIDDPAAAADLSGDAALPEAEAKAAATVAKPAAETVPKAAVSTPLPGQDSLRTAQTSAPKAPETTAGTPLLHASLKATNASWVAVCYDGKERFQHLLAAGATQEIVFAETALVRLGNGPAVEITLDGRSIQESGLPGVVRTVELTAGGARSVSYRAGSKACGNGTATATPSEPTAIAN